MHCRRRRLLRRGLEFHVCTINKSAHTKKVWKLIVCTSYNFFYVSWPTVFEGDLKSPFPIVTTMRWRGERSPFPWLLHLPLIRTLKWWGLSKKALSCWAKSEDAVDHTSVTRCSKNFARVARTSKTKQDQVGQKVSILKPCSWPTWQVRRFKLGEYQTSSASIVARHLQDLSKSFRIVPYIAKILQNV